MSNKTFERVLYVFVGLLVVARLSAEYIHQKELRTANMAPAPVPTFEWRDFDSDKHDFKALKGKVVILHFWASWCGPCRTEFPSLLHAAELLKDDAVFLTISADETDSAARKFVTEAKLKAQVKPDNMLYGWDPMKRVSFDIFQTAAMPESIIIDTEQVMRRKFVGMVNWEDPQIIQYIRDLRKDEHAQKVPVPQ